MRPNSLLSVSIAQILLLSLLNVLAPIRAIFGKLKGVALGLGLPKLPIMMADDDNYKDNFKYIVLAIVVLVVGAVIVSIVSGVGLYILGIFNSTVVKIPSSYNYVGSVSPAIGSVFEILLVALIIVALVFVIKRLMKVADEF
jgi:predicted membrane protein